MTFDSIPIRFTENKYASKKEVSNDLKTPLIEPFWEKILTYRKQFSRALPLFSLEKKVYFFCLCNSISTKINSCEMKLINLLSSYQKLNSQETNDLQLFSNSCLVDCLKTLSDGQSFEVDDNYLLMLINNKISDNTKQFNELYSYFSCLKLSSHNFENSFDEDLIFKIYSKLINDDELTSLYRSNSQHQSMGIMYTQASIDKMMADLYKFVNEFDVQTLVKAAMVFYYITYLKPFEKENEKMALILTKIVLAKGNLGYLAFLLNIEPLIYQLNNSLASVLNNVDKNSDLTYFLIVFIDLINQCCEDLMIKINNLKALQLKNDYYQEEYKEANIKKEEVSHENKQIEQLSNQLADLEQAKTITTKQNVIDTPTVSVDNGLAINILPPQLSEKDLNRLEEDLLESNPELKRGQAYFYVRHCTMGKRYTISQFKKEVGCAYETARTSMDALAKLGYYRQEFVKNKKVYTPIKRK